MNKKIKVAIIVLSDSCFAKKNKDSSGQEIKKIILSNKISSGWEISNFFILPDNKKIIRKYLVNLVDVKNVDFIVTTGGTGITKKDLTTEATRTVIEKELPGISELLRMEGYKKNIRAVLSRGLCGTRKKSLILNLPGSTNAVRESLPLVIPLVEHIIDLLNGKTRHT